MAQPTPFDPNADYSADISPGDLGNALDRDFTDLQLTTDEILTNLGLLQRDDGKPANAIVHPDSFTAAALALIASTWTPRGMWATATLYHVGDVVEQASSAYVAATEHVSGTFATDHTAGKWVAFSHADALATAFTLTLLDDADAGAWLTTLGFSTFFKTLIDDANAGAVLTTLGVTSAAQSILDDASTAAILTTLGLTATAAEINKLSGATPTTAEINKLSGVTATTAEINKLAGIAGSLAQTSEFTYANLFSSAGRLLYPAGYVQGLIQANNVGDAVNDIDISGGACADSNGTHNIILSAITKRLDAAWAVGTNQGGLDTGSIGDSDYYIWAIKRSDTGVADALFSLSATAPTMPTSYDKKRLIGWLKRVAGTIVAMHCYETAGGGLELLWDVPTLDINLAATLTTTRRTDAVKVPLNFSVMAHLNVVINDASPGAMAWIYCPDHPDTAPSNSAAPLNNTGMTSTITARQLRVRTSAAGLIAARADTATIDNYRVSTIGFEWSRR